jgi:hypothetical protein
MPRKPTGSRFRSDAGRLYVVLVGDNDRESCPLDPKLTEGQAEQRKELVADLAVRLRASGNAARDATVALLERAAVHEGKSAPMTRAQPSSLSLWRTAGARPGGADRTGHRSSVMIQRYRRAARTFAELGLGELASLAQALPELAGNGTGNGTDEGERGLPKVKIKVISTSWPRGEMADAVDLKSAALAGVPVRVRAGLPLGFIGLFDRRRCGASPPAEPVPPFPPAFSARSSGIAVSSGASSPSPSSAAVLAARR